VTPDIGHGTPLSTRHKHLHLHPPKETGRGFPPLPKTPPGRSGASVISYGELFYGAAKRPHGAAALAQLRELLDLLPVLALPETAAEAYGAMRAELEFKGEMIGNNDLWIAAHALAAGFTLVTNNEKEFRRVRGLKVQNWAK
jgi:tRNA(fMet)-specific endonuclease VapC